MSSLCGILGKLKKITGEGILEEAIKNPEILNLFEFYALPYVGNDGGKKAIKGKIVSHMIMLGIVAKIRYILKRRPFVNLQ